MAGSLYESVNSLPIPQHLSPMVCTLSSTSMPLRNTARHIAMGRLRDVMVYLPDSRFLSWPPRPTSTFSPRTHRELRRTL